MNCSEKTTEKAINKIKLIFNCKLTPEVEDCSPD